MYHIGLFLGFKFNVHYNKYYFAIRVPYFNLTVYR